MCLLDRESVDEKKTKKGGRVCMCGHEGSKGLGTSKEKNIRDDSETSHGTSTHTSFSKSLTNAPNLSHTNHWSSDVYTLALKTHTSAVQRGFNEACMDQCLHSSVPERDSS